MFGLILSRVRNSSESPFESAHHAQIAIPFHPISPNRISSPKKHNTTWQRHQPPPTHQLHLAGALKSLRGPTPRARRSSHIHLSIIKIKALVPQHARHALAHRIFYEAIHFLITKGVPIKCSPFARTQCRLSNARRKRTVRRPRSHTHTHKKHPRKKKPNNVCRPLLHSEMTL